MLVEDSSHGIRDGGSEQVQPDDYYCRCSPPWTDLWESDRKRSSKGIVARQRWGCCGGLNTLQAALLAGWGHTPYLVRYDQQSCSGTVRVCGEAFGKRAWLCLCAEVKLEREDVDNVDLDRVGSSVTTAE